MGIDECLERYPGLADSVFGEGKKRSVMRRIVKLTSTKYDSTQLEKAINAIIQTRIPEREPRQKNFGFEQFHSPSDLCKTYVFPSLSSFTCQRYARLICTTSSAVVAKEDNDVSSQTYVFRTYDLYCDPVEYHNPGPAHIDEIWKVGRATSAAPTFFKPIEIGGKKYSDGGVGHNNPVMIMLDEVTQGKRVNDTFHVVLSIGTGQKPTTIEKVQHKFPRLSEFKPVKKLVNILKALTDEAVNVENNHRSFQRITKEVGFEHYYRWRGGENVGGLKMDEWVTRPKRGKQTTEGFIRENVDAFMDQDDVKAQLDQLANKLVETRRARILNREKIRRFTWCTLYRCPVCVDADDGEWQETLDTLEAHILEVHTDIPPQDVEGLIRHLPPRLPPLCAPF